MAMKTIQHQIICCSEELKGLVGMSLDFKLSTHHEPGVIKLPIFGGSDNANIYIYMVILRESLDF